MIPEWIWTQESFRYVGVRFRRMVDNFKWIFSCETGKSSLVVIVFSISFLREKLSLYVWNLLMHNSSNCPVLKIFRNNIFINRSTSIFIFNSLCCSERSEFQSENCNIGSAAGFSLWSSYVRNLYQYFSMFSQC